MQVLNSSCIFYFGNCFNNFFLLSFCLSQPQNPQSCALCSDTDIIERMFGIVNPQLWAEPCQTPPMPELEVSFRTSP
nr:MAG TPA: hypothetical protein [Caudoviricetes sp.]